MTAEFPQAGIWILQMVRKHITWDLVDTKTVVDAFLDPHTN